MLFRSPLARLALLFSGQAMEGLRASKRRQLSCQRLRHWWSRLAEKGGDPEALPEVERLDFHAQLKADLPALLLRLDPHWAQAAMPRWRDAADPLFHPAPPIDGDSLRHQLALPPGPQLGALLRHLARERAFGRLPTQAMADDEQTLTEARRWLSRAAVPRHG